MMTDLVAAEKAVFNGLEELTRVQNASPVFVAQVDGTCKEIQDVQNAFPANFIPENFKKGLHEVAEGFVAAAKLEQYINRPTPTLRPAPGRLLTPNGPN